MRSPTIKEVARRTGLSEFTVRKNIEVLLPVLPIGDRVAVLEHMLICKERKRGVLGGCLVIDLDEMPANPNAASMEEFLGITQKELWKACKEYERRMKKAKDPHREFGLKKELIQEVAREIMNRNLEWIADHLDPANPFALLSALGNAPQDRPAWVLRLLRRHGFKKVDLSTWVAADNFLTAWVGKFTQEALGMLIKKR